MSEDARLARIETKVDGVLERLDKMNGAVSRHDVALKDREIAEAVLAVEIKDIRSDVAQKPSWGKLIGLIVGVFGLLQAAAILAERLAG